MDILSSNSVKRKKIFVSNSELDHPSRHQTTWIGQIKDRTIGKIINILTKLTAFYV